MDIDDAELERIADDLGVDVTALQSDAVKECAESVFEDDPDMSKSEAFAICQDRENEGLLQSPHVALAEQADPGRIERVEEADGAVRYRNLKLLGVGVWGDSGSGRHFLYSERTMANLAENVDSTTLNLFHERENEVTDVGDLDPDSLFIGEADDGLYGDIVLHMDNAASEFADEALQNALESGGQEGLKGPSLEIAGQEYEFDRAEGVHELVEGRIIGLALVGLGVSPGPGSKDAAFAEQTRERAVALASNDGATVLTQQDNDPTMTPTVAEQLADQLDDDALHELADEYDIELQSEGEMDMAQDLIEQATNEGFDPSDQSVDELRAFIAENLDPSEDAMAAFDDVVSAVLETEEADSEDVVAAEDVLDWIAEQADGEPEEPDDENGGEEMDMADLEARVAALEETLSGVELSDLDESVTALSEQVEEFAAAERVSDLADTVTELQDTVEAIAEEPEEPTSLASMGAAEVNGAEDGEPVYVDFGTTETNREY